MRKKRKSDRSSNDGDEPKILPRYRKPARRGKFMTGFVNIPPHAIDRFIEKCAVNSISIEDAEKIIIGMYRSGCRFGAQAGTDFLVKAKRNRTGEEFVFACLPVPTGVVIRTVLTMEEALANMSRSNLI